MSTQRHDLSDPAFGVSHSLITSLSALLAMQYRCAPLPIPRDLARWFAGRSDPDAVLELGSVLRRCLLLGDAAVVLRELKGNPQASAAFQQMALETSAENPHSGVTPQAGGDIEEWKGFLPH